MSRRLEEAERRTFDLVNQTSASRQRMLRLEQRIFQSRRKGSVLAGGIPPEPDPIWFYLGTDYGEPDSSLYPLFEHVFWSSGGTDYYRNGVPVEIYKIVTADQTYVYSGISSRSDMEFVRNAVADPANHGRINLAGLADGPHAILILSGLKDSIGLQVDYEQNFGSGGTYEEFGTFVSPYAGVDTGTGVYGVSKVWHNEPVILGPGIIYQYSYDNSSWSNMTLVSGSWKVTIDAGNYFLLATFTSSTWPSGRAFSVFGRLTDVVDYASTLVSPTEVATASETITDNTMKFASGNSPGGYVWIRPNYP
jgi:hypothetical protein